MSSITHEGARQHLTRLLREQLSAITFVRDYVQLHFDGPVISAFSLPKVTVDGKAVSFGEAGYRDALCSRIGLPVLMAFVDPEEEMRIGFSDGSWISVSLKAEGRVVAEAAVYQDQQTNEWASW
jgi:hypothetical protein